MCGSSTLFQSAIQLTFPNARRQCRAHVVAATGRMPAAGKQQGRGGKQQGLVCVLLQQARQEVWDGWLSDLLIPFVSDDPGSVPPQTRPPHELAEQDSRFVKVDGVVLHYKECWPAAAAPELVGSTGTSSATSRGGSTSSTTTPNQQQQQQSERPAVLLIHGFNGSVFSWRTTMQGLADQTGCRVIAFDRPPFGLSQRPLSWGKAGDLLQYNPFPPEGNARLASGLLDALGVGSVVAVGHSAGALVCMELVQQQPWRIAGLCFVAPALPSTPENSFTRRANLGQQLRFLLTRGLLADDTLGLRYVRRQILRRRDEVAAGRLGQHTDEAQVSQDVIDGYLRPLLAHDWDRGALLNLRAFSIPPSYDYASVTAPVLLVQGSNDGALTKNARELAKLLHQRPQGDTRFVELEGIGHIPMEKDECPELLNSLLADFVRRSIA